uniref:Uncharacterized protein n=1 Tax=Peromyscus maniculatus bairdii TaxID=230844 RepID=A0A8C8W4N4_PERMB
MDCKALLVNHLIISASFHFLLNCFLQSLKCFMKLLADVKMTGHGHSHMTTAAERTSFLGEWNGFPAT